MRIGIDARFVGPEGTGLGKYTEKLIENLAILDDNNQYVIFLRRSNWDWLRLKSKNFKKVLADIPWYSLKEQIKLPKIFSNQNLDLLHFTHFNVPVFYRGKFIVTIHDLIHHRFRQESATTRNLYIFKIKRFAYRHVINHAVKDSQKILTPSNFVKDEIVRTFRIDPAKIVVTYEAAEEEYFRTSSKFKVQSSKFLEKYNINQPFIIYIGNAYPHKNLERLLQAFKILVHGSQSTVHRIEKHPWGERKLHLILVCPRDIFWQRLKERIKNLGLEEGVVLTGYIPPKELSEVLRSAQAYVFPSLSEGFGIPGLNSMAAGLPAVCSNIPTLKEIYGDAALYFDPEDPKDISRKIQKVLTDTTTRSDLVVKGLEQVQKYSWLKMARETLKVYVQYSL
ncbi:MAG: mannosyltransferase B-like protein [Candidatus Curtissbacteria bacterium GW2011_GWA1_40_47]|nr:MAG: mannosyltransferase B-like protein [Candidatus Curtissbacteria bacterium GW2011_GWB1_40_28]KKR62411.1 MAG: glycosyl transferase, group 1 [Microgenomates group bacterium GW2011_GWC1_40_35]KKR66388.1 MAG: mannosyltransferase B-like protein [Candidatus Curtissbacteria bacterium GW2011_GWA1_40_47]KKR77763.1 MAG: mannosyltransferase B-like protein [Candidatus Curtissbacteria bacterium GW2011_GWD1_40_8]KKS02579.1 MAG: mannosyltransferase B-like protein [Candidatus Curtissbacteria bacterium GW